VLAEAVAKYGMRLLGWCVVPNHWHLVPWPREDGELSAFMRWLCTAHVRRWHEHRHSLGEGHLYQGFKSFPGLEHRWAPPRRLPLRRA
jgi:putative transposase